MSSDITNIKVELIRRLHNSKKICDKCRKDFASLIRCFFEQIENNNILYCVNCGHIFSVADIGLYEEEKKGFLCQGCVTNLADVMISGAEKIEQTKG